MADQSPEMTAGEPSVADLAGAILDEEARRRADQAERDAETILPDDLLPGVGDKPMTLREGLRVGGASMLAMMFVLNMLDELPRAIRVLAPDIQESLDISDTVLFGVLSFGGVTLVLGAVPMAALADRVKRVAIIPVSSAFWGVTAFLSGLIVNPFQLFLTNAGTGLGQAYRIPVSNSLLVDTYPIQARSRIFALEGVGRPVGQLLGPLAVGGIAALVGGEDPWRVAFFAVAVAPVMAAIVSAIVLREPPRGRFEKQAVFGDEQVDVEELPVSIGTAFARLRKIKTFYFLTTGVGVLGFALIAIPIQFNLLLEDKYAMGPFQRGVVESLIWVVALIGLPVAGRAFDRGFRRDPSAVMRMSGMLVVAAGVVYAVALPIKILGGLVALIAVAQTLISMAFVAAPSIIASVSPYRIRAQAFALLPVFIFLMGGFFGGLIVGQLSDAYNERTAMLVAAPPAALIGGALIAYGSRFIRRDISGRWRNWSRSRRSSSGRPPIPRRSPPSRSTTSTSPTAACRFSSTCPSRWPGVRCWPCSAPTARASRPCCGPLAGWAFPTGEWCVSRDAPSPTQRPRTASGPDWSSSGAEPASSRSSPWPITSGPRCWPPGSTRPRSGRECSGPLRPSPLCRPARPQPPASCPAASSRCWPWPWP